MTELHASRTLVKSAPELWAECSDAASLARHLGAFGEIRITRVEPETAVAWEGVQVSGTVRLEPAGWGTKVTLTAERPAAGTSGDDPEAAPPPPQPVPHRTAEAQPAPSVGVTSRRGLLGWLTALLRPSGPPPPPRPNLGPPTDADAGAGATPPARSGVEAEAEAALAAALDSLGQAHHRPYSRA